MGNFFSLEGPLISSLDKCGRVIILSVLWTVCCLPIITIGASSTAFYYGITKTIMHERSSPAKEFFKAFKRSFKRSTQFSLIILPLSLLLVLDIYVYYRKNSQVSFFSANVCLVLLFVLTGFALFVYPVISRFVLGFKETARFAFLLAFKHLPVTLGLMVLFVLTVAMIIIFPLCAAFLPGTACILASLMVEKVFKKYIPEPEEGKELWYDE